MGTYIFLGEPPANIKQWIIDHATPPSPAGRAETRVWWSADESDYDDYLIENNMDYSALIEAGLMPEGAGTQLEPGWITQPVKVEIGTAVNSIGHWAFYCCNNLTSVTIPDSVTSIGESVFYCCSELMNVMIPNNVTNIDAEAFAGCSKLMSVTIPDSVTSISYAVFTGCNITNVTIVATGKPGASATSVKQAMIDAGVDPNITWNMPTPAGHSDTRFTLEGGMVETHNITGTLDQQWMIDNGYFNENEWEWTKTITQADIGNTVTSINGGAFYNCSGLTNVTIPDSVESIDGSAFRGCSSLTSVIFNSFTKNQVKSMTTENYIFGEAFYDPDTGNQIAKSFTAVCTDGSMTINFSADDPATITFTDL